MKQYETIIGLEVHAQLLTKTKMFCACSTLFGTGPNVNICPICTGQPGTLPAINREAVAMAIKTGLALNCSIKNTSVFARKNYFYPDLPKGYQISQFDKPLCENGKLTIEHEGEEKDISIVRIHMEEDAGKLLHDWGNENRSHVDFNRCGIPLIEIVSGPDMRSPEEGVAYLKTLRSVLMYLGVCDGNMQEGSFRCDANLSVMKKGSKKFGTRTELKNLNSFKAIERALLFEQKRQIENLEKGEKVIQETRLWDEGKQKTVSMRTKEEAHDYRYFPEPDLGPLEVSDTWIGEIKNSLPELAGERTKRFVTEYGIPEYDAKVLTAEKTIADFFEKASKIYSKSPKKTSNWVMTEVMAMIKETEEDISECNIKPEDVAYIVKSIDCSEISGKIGKEVIEEVFQTGERAENIVSKKGLKQISDEDEIEKIVDEILSKETKNVEDYKAGKIQVFGHFVGQVMKATKGKANPRLVNEILKKKLQ